MVASVRWRRPSDPRSQPPYESASGDGTRAGPALAPSGGIWRSEDGERPAHGRIGSGCGPSSHPTCGRTWPTLPLDPSVRYPHEIAYESWVSSSSNAEWQQRLGTEPRCIQYIEGDVIGNPGHLRQASLLTATPLSPHGAVRAADTYTAANVGRQLNRNGPEGIAVPSRSQSCTPHGLFQLRQEHSDRSGPSPSARCGRSWRLEGNVGPRRHGKRGSESFSDL